MVKSTLPPVAYYILPFAVVFVICFSIFQFMISTSSNNKQPILYPSLEDKLKNRSPIFNELSQEARHIFPSYIKNPTSVDFSVMLGGSTGKSHTMSIIIPENQLSMDGFQNSYLPKFSENKWLRLEDQKILSFTQESTHFVSCVFYPNTKMAHAWLIEFKAAGSYCL
jgi:hypothetical protein